MPELPEVETVRRGLAPFIEGRQVIEAGVEPRPICGFPFRQDFAARMRGASFDALHGGAPNICSAEMVKGDARFYWLSHLGMTGRFMLAACRR